MKRVCDQGKVRSSSVETGIAMRRNVYIATLAAGVAALSASSPVLAQKPVTCQYGKTADGKCANGAVMMMMQQRATVFTQSKLSYTGLPLPQGTGAYAQQTRSINNQDIRYDVYGSNPNGAAAPSGTFIRLPAGVNPASLHLAAPFTVSPGGITIR
jgi:hypothetical protein